VDGKQKVADLIADRVGATADRARPATMAEPSDGAAETTSQPRRARSTRWKRTTPKKRDRFWKMRKAGLPILLSRTTDEKHISFIEDCAIPPEHLPEYTREFQEILDDNDTFATFYAHAGPGVLHIRP